MAISYSVDFRCSDSRAATERPCHSGNCRLEQVEDTIAVRLADHHVESGAKGTSASKSDERPKCIAGTISDGSASQTRDQIAFSREVF